MVLIAEYLILCKLLGFPPGYFIAKLTLNCGGRVRGRGREREIVETEGEVGTEGEI